MSSKQIKTVSGLPLRSSFRPDMESKAGMVNNVRKGSSYPTQVHDSHWYFSSKGWVELYSGADNVQITQLIGK